MVDVVPRLFELVGPTRRHALLEGMPLVVLPPARLRARRRDQARCGHRRGVDRARAIAPLFAVVARDQAGLPGPGHLPPEAARPRHAAVHVPEVPHDAGGHRPDEHRAYIESTRAPTRRIERKRASTSSSRATRSRASAAGSARRASTSFLSSSTCSAATCRSSGRAVHPVRGRGLHAAPLRALPRPAGITGLWQVSARAHSTFGEALDMDVAYARGWSLGLDLRLLCRTPVRAPPARRATA